MDLPMLEERKKGDMITSLLFLNRSDKADIDQFFEIGRTSIIKEHNKNQVRNELGKVRKNTSKVIKGWMNGTNCTTQHKLHKALKSSKSYKTVEKG